MSYENEFEKTGGEFSEGAQNAPEKEIYSPEINGTQVAAEEKTAQENTVQRMVAEENIASENTALFENEVKKADADCPEYKRIDAEISEAFSEGASVRGLARELPENSSAVNGTAHIPSAPAQNTQGGSAQNTPESVGIRYNAEKGSGDGAYTWNYCQNEDNSSGKKKGKKGFVVFMSAAMALLLVGTAALSAVITSNFIRKSEAYTQAETQEAGKPVIGNKNEGKTQQMVQVPDDVLGETLTKQQISVKCKPSSVGIEVITTTSGFYGYSYQSRGVGSGFILTDDGYIATNHHVVNGASKITVQLDDGTKYDATLIGSDSVTDLAVLKVEATGLVPMQIGDSDKMVVGDSVIAIGTPAGIEFAGTVTDGIISAINRDVEITNDRGTVVKTMTLMQTNAAINPGNSGGPLINDRGEVIGINTLKLTSTYEGIGFSIPINSAVRIFNQLITDGKVSEYDNSFVTGGGAIGITQYAEISKQEAQYYGIPEGIIVIQIQNTSSAMSAGLRRGDIIIGFCGDKVTTVEQLNRLKSKYRAGDEVTLRIYRDGEGEKDITFKLDMMES